jgi:nonsense-mediated mRNA decay protein 3
MENVRALIVLFRMKTSEQLLSTDTHSGTSTYKFTYSVEIAPICKDDLVALSLKQARSLGNINPLVVCTRVGNTMHLMDPNTLQTCEISAPVFWRIPFSSLANVSDLVEFTVLDIELNHSIRKGKWVMADAQVAMTGAFKSQSKNAKPTEYDEDMDYEELGSTSQIYHTRTHLGSILQPGDTVMGYHLTNANFNNDEFAVLPSDRIPDVVLVKKSYPNRRKKNKTRNWKLKSIAKEVDADDGKGVVGRMGGRDQKKVDEDYEIFLRDLEEDQEMRGTVNLYKAGGDDVAKKRGKKQFGMDVDDVEEGSVADMESEVGTEVGDDDIGPSLDELLDDLHLDDENPENEEE